MVEILTGVHRIDGINPYSYVIVEYDGSLTLIDTGMSKDRQKVLGYVQANMSKKPSDLKTILLTHCHTPYVSGVYAIKKAIRSKFCYPRGRCRLSVWEEDDVSA
jgi:glyoxylase-like metal-dependent hydrolase (beta-lactamase superfamily II)